MALTIFLAASFKSDADNIFILDLSNISLPSLKFVPANLTTRGTESFTCFAASTTPSAKISSHYASKNIYENTFHIFIS